MKSKTLIVIFALTIFLVSAIVTQSFSHESKQLFQQGLMAENGEGNLQDAITIYEKGSGLHNFSLSPDGTKLAGMDYSIGQNIVVFDRLTNQTQIITNYDTKCIEIKD